MFVRTFGVAIVSGMLAAVNPLAANAATIDRDQIIELAAMGQAEHEAFNIIRNLKQLVREIKGLERKLEELKKELREVEKAESRAKNAKEKKEIGHKIRSLKHGYEVILHNIHVVKGQFMRGRHSAENLMHHLDGRSRYIEQEIKRLIREIEALEKNKKEMAKVERLKHEVGKLEPELKQIASFLNNLKRELRQL